MSKIIEWDWKEQLDMEEIFEAIEEFLDKKIRPYFYIVDTEGDSFAVLISDLKDLKDNKISKLYEDWYNEEDDE